MSKVLSIDQAIKMSQEIRNQNKKIVLAGGCFDILHVGHIEFLRNAKKEGDVLLVFLESDESIKKIKGPERPINSQADRAKVLASLEIVDCVVLLPELKSNTEYDQLVSSIKPAIIAITKGDPGKSHKDRQAEKIGAKVVEVTDTVSNRSTTKLLKILTEI